MTAITPARTKGRVLNVVRLQFISRQTFLWIPLIVLGGSLAFSVLLFAMIPTAAPKYGGGAQAPLWVFLAMGIGSLTQSFPYSQALSLTRREFFLGTLVAAALAGLVPATAFTLLGLLERATEGYGVNGYFAYLPYVWEAGPAAAWLVFFVTTMFLFVLGFWVATIFRRWGSAALTAVLVLLGLVLVGSALLITRLSAWPQVGAWFAATGALGLALWALPLTALMAAGSYVTLRRATP